jgi:hypothetical protein
MDARFGDVGVGWIVYHQHLNFLFISTDTQMKCTKYVHVMFLLRGIWWLSVSSVLIKIRYFEWRLFRSDITSKLRNYCQELNIG